jgi:hypothetical protein
MTRHFRADFSFVQNQFPANFAQPIHGLFVIYLQPELLMIRYYFLPAEIRFQSEDCQRSYEIPGRC